MTLPESLTLLRKELLLDYKYPINPPNSAPMPLLTPCQKLSLKHYIAWKRSNGTVKAYGFHAELKSSSLYYFMIANRWASSITFRISFL
jgi:hypothetical protein